MLGYFALYTWPLARAFAEPSARSRSPFGLLPHEIAALNAR